VDRLESKFVGSLTGAALGDAVGELAFRLPARERLTGELAWRAELSYTDDTAMAIALAESLLSTGDVDSEHLGRTLSTQYEHEPWRGYGPGPPTIFAAVAAEGIPYRAAARRLYSGQGSYGNGAAMRAAPLGIYFHDSRALYDKARAQAEATHTHPLGIDGAAVQSRAVALAVNLDPTETADPQELAGPFLEELMAFARTEILGDKLAEVRRLLEGCAGPGEAIHRLGHSLAVHESLPFALYSFLSHPDSFAETVFCATLHGGDRDTMGAMAGAVSGAYLGAEALPGEWRAKLEHRERIEALAAQLFRAQGGSRPR